MRTLHFWSVTLGAAIAIWLVAGMVLLLSAGADEPADWMPASAYLVVALLLPPASAFVAMHWGAARWHPGPRREPSAGLVTRIILAAIMRSMVFVLLVLTVLLVQAALARQPGGLAAVSAVVAGLEAVIFSGMGAALASLVRNQAWAVAAGWFVAVFLLAGGIGTCALLVPAVRSEEPVTVAMNVQRGQNGVVLAYECSSVPAGTAEVYRTDRIMWLAAPSPIVVSVMLAAEQDAGNELLGWLSARLQEAADGTQVACVHGEPLDRDAARVPLGAAGLLMQGGLAGLLVLGAQMVSWRRRIPAGPAGNA
ncbi:hypothetical protein [Pseudarthrobacter sp. NPDC058119]|uniref:hypothetical protein n=1 Tax=Pseudarthrobacter sp. NPDC058119 TaxID=3346348 RepID=UPI0036D94C4E